MGNNRKQNDERKLVGKHGRVSGWQVERCTGRGFHPMQQRFIYNKYLPRQAGACANIMNWYLYREATDDST